MFKITSLSGVEHNFRVLRQSGCSFIRSNPIFMLLRVTTDWNSKLNLGIQMFRNIVLSGVEHNFKVLRHQVIDLLG